MAAALPLPAALPPWARVQSVWELCQRMKHQLALDDDLAEAWVRGEVSNAKAAPSGHVYFTLKDDHAQVACVMWSGARRLGFALEDGLGVLVRGRVGMYEARGQVQLVAEEVHPDGHGRHHLAFQQLKAKLEAEGLFAAARKRPLPRFPRRIVLVTSLQGAALRDMLRILGQRYPLAEVVVRPARVQGDGAGAELAQAIAHADARAGADVLVVGRGGGSLEDLWAFNEEAVARAIAACRTPVVSAVGHETDVTIADFVADLRAATPSNAAERVVPDAAELRERLAMAERRLAQRARRALERAAQRLADLEHRAALRRPDRVLEGRAQRLDELAWRLAAAAETRMAALDARLARAAALLDSYSPLRTLERGYALVRVGGAPARSVRQLPPGTRAEVRLADGSVEVVSHG